MCLSAGGHSNLVPTGGRAGSYPCSCLRLGRTLHLPWLALRYQWQFPKQKSDVTIIRGWPGLSLVDVQPKAIGPHGKLIILVSPPTRLFTSVGMAIFSFLNCKSISVGQAQKFSRHILSRTCGIRYSSFLLGHFALTSSLFFAYHK